MKSNTSKGRADKGSKFWMQLIPNTDRKNELDQFLHDDLRWLCPLEGPESEYLEYELNHPAICQELGILDPRITFDFWPRRQPQWDGLAVSEATKTLYLVEAKAHLKELSSKCMASESSKAKIKETMFEVFKKGFPNCPEENFNNWMESYYQLGNRLTFLQKMKELNLEKYPNVKLILLNFVNDYTYKEVALSAWQPHFEEVFEAMTGDKALPLDVIVVYYDVSQKRVIE